MPGPVTLRRGFTLIEVMIAATLMIAIITMAMIAMRTAAKSIAVLGALRAENRLLRQGITAGLEDLDFWHSDANPDYPYLKGAMSAPYVDAADRIVGSDSRLAKAKRPFRPVTFGVGLSPAGLLPHDPATWYRNHLNSNCRPKVPNGHEEAWRWRENYVGDANRGITAKGYWNGTWSEAYGAINRDRDLGDSIMIPAGWTPRWIHGDYALVANAGSEMDPATAADPLMRMRGSRPHLVMRIFRELGLMGVYEYLPAGSIALVQEPSSGLATQTAGTPARRIGEIPGETADSIMSKAFMVDAIGTAPLAYGGAAEGDQRGFLWQSLAFISGSGDSDMAMSQSQVIGASFGSYAQDLESLNRRDRPAFLSTRIEWSDYSDQWIFPSVAAAICYPFTRLSTENYTDAGLVRTGRQRYSSRISLQPLGRADETGSLEPEASSAAQPRLRLSTFRWREQGRRMAECRVEVGNPERGFRMTIPLTALGTTWRGARQHWAVAAARRTDLPAMGDRHAR